MPQSPTQNWQRAALARVATDRWHFQHGPIDLVIDLDAPAPLQALCIADCWHSFQGLLSEVAAELPALRRPASDHPVLRGSVARRMGAACAPYADDVFVTPMAAVAGSVADELIGIFKRPGVRRASINNGGDIALHLAPGASYTVGVWPRIYQPGIDRPALARPGIEGVFIVDETLPVRGIATSGWRGRSFSLGIADSVTVLAHDAAAADAAATLIANAVDCDAPGIVRAAASSLKDDSDLGERLVTVDVPRLPAAARACALAGGKLQAQRCLERGLIHAAALFLQGSVEVVSAERLAAVA